MVSGVAIAVLGLSGCGGGSGSSTTQQTTTTGTGYYVDSAVVGVDYVCGNKQGKTGASGEFTFEKGQNCSFTLAGIPLKTVPADYLVDGKKVIENNVTVAQLLQSIDSDGNLSNGIQITDEVVKAIEGALDGSTSATKENVLKDNSALETVVSAVGQEVEGVSENVKSVQEVIQHLEQTQVDVTKELLAGKTFYSVHAEEKILIKIVFNADATAFTETNVATGESEVNPIRIEGDRWYGLDDTDRSYTIISQADGYIYFDDRNGDGSKDGIGHRLYTSQVDAEAYLDSFGNAASDSLSDLIVGKTFYYVQNDDFGHEEQAGFNLAKIVFKTDGTLIWEEINTIDAGTPYNSTYSFKDNHLVLFDNEDGGNGEYNFVKQNNDYIEIYELGDNEPAYLFYDEQKAKDFVNKMNNHKSVSYYMLQKSDIAGHSILVGDPSKDKEYFTNYTYTSLETNASQRDTGTWSIEDGKLKHKWDSNGHIEIHSFAQKPATGVMLTNETYNVSGKITEYK